MSEHEAFVACRCYRDGLTSQPPVDPKLLDYDRFGQIKPAGLYGMEATEDEALWQWWESKACTHEGMREICLIWWAEKPGIGVIKEALDAGQVPAVTEVLERGSQFDSAVIIAEPELAASALIELQAVFDRAKGDSERHLLDAGYGFLELRNLLSASVRTGNPVVGFYNGSSLGFAP
ncbi:hypothetical protein [Leucobacter ruminantium]|uniref:Uncharacterized protein n=1 Tax=Leucobacter ruminantium TaxID=1289170 RepID=A0A939LVN6_9MICO|nr:hypothetical protein [Leucobacter ruminantium]MBO1805272.1 hypothetical protein [Leucobacter ruminantium]